MNNHKYQIYQLDKNNPNVMNNRKMFMDWDMLHKYCGGFDITDYKVVYDSKIKSKKTIDEILEDLFEIFNINHPDDFHGHSLSISDIVVIDGTTYFCDSIGWKKI